MTTYTISGFKLSYSGNSISNIAPLEMKVVLPDSDDSFTYTVTGKDADSFAPNIEMEGVEAYNWYFNGVSGGLFFDNDNDKDLAGFMSWGAGNAAYFIDFWDSSANEDYIFQMGGVALPTFTSVAQLNMFNASLSGGGEITSGPYAPGQEIRLDGFTNVVVSENDVIKGDGAANIFRGGAGRDKIFGAGGDDKLFGDAAMDKIFAGNGKDKLSGGNGNDRLFGGKGSDVIKGGNHNDYLDGGDHSDKLIGGAGDDYFYGGSGKDKFIFSKVSKQGDNAIGDFQDGVDLIVIRGAVEFENLTIDADGTDTVISWLETSVTLEGVDLALISADDFSFA